MRNKRAVRKRILRKRSTDEKAVEQHIISASKGERNSIIYLGELVERTLASPFGSVIRALTAGRVDIEMRGNRDGKLSSDRVLGRCEMANILWHDLEMFVLDKDRLGRPEIKDEEVEQGFSSAPGE